VTARSLAFRALLVAALFAAVVLLFGSLVPGAGKPGGVGGVEPVMLGVLTASGVDAGTGLAAIVCYRAIALGVQASLGVVAVATLAPEIGTPRATGERT
jgi:uncharacterized membrane protein YbhN (UPF0104 family)